MTHLLQLGEERLLFHLALRQPLLQLVALLAELLELLHVRLLFGPFERQLCVVALESFLQQRIRMPSLSQLCQERLFLPLYLEQPLLQLVALLSEPLELLPVSLVFSAFLRHLPCHPLEFFLHLSVRLAGLLPLVQKLLLLLLCLR